LFLESALEREMDTHLGYTKHDAAGDNSGSSRDGRRAKMVVTEVGTLGDLGAQRPGRLVRATTGRQAPAPSVGVDERRLNNLHHPAHYDRRLCKIFYLSAQTVMSKPRPSQEYYRRKRDEGRSHVQAVLSLARLRVDALWAMSRDRRRYTAGLPAFSHAVI
jgi:hypothetical protein